jgi:hypothetical protein
MPRRGGDFAVADILTECQLLLRYTGRVLLRPAGVRRAAGSTGQCSECGVSRSTAGGRYAASRRSSLIKGYQADGWATSELASLIKCRGALPPAGR